MGGGAIPLYVEWLILEHLIECCTQNMLYGYSWVTNCTDDGRRSMRWDIESFQAWCETKL